MNIVPKKSRKKISKLSKQQCKSENEYKSAAYKEQRN